MSRKTEQTRNRILEASRKLLETGRGSSVRMSDMAREAGITRQALYLHFRTRAELLIATTRYVDEVNGVEARLVASRTASSGKQRLREYVDAWANYIPEIHGFASALMAMQDTDPAAATAWRDRSEAVRHGCAAVVDALAADGVLSSDYSRGQAIDLMWTLLSVPSWEQLTGDCGWSQAQYVAVMQQTLLTLLVDAGPIDD